MAHIPVSRSGSLATAASTLGSGDGSVLSSAIQVADHLSDLGKAIPFIAPAFILLKIIIDIEQRAQEVDAKCNDIIERLTFMLSHLPILEKIEVMPSTRKVLDRIQEVMKSAAALIAAYRKQSKVARRLSLSNREKFTLCAEQINTCCSDLLMSLQIHQSKQLESLMSRAVPVDEEDAAAQTFVASHGGSVDAVMYDRELVKEFAQQQHFIMDDSVMEQLNANIADSVQQNSVRLETIIRDNVNTAIVEGLKNLASQLTAVENEQRFTCVQCESSFTHSTNGPTACNFHRAEYDSWRKQYPCCSTNHPCQYSSHRSKHHCDYPYGPFFPRARAVTGYTDTSEEWTSVEDSNLETDEVQKAYVGQLYRWASRGARVEEATLLITVGRVRYSNPYYFNTFTTKELEDITKSVRLSRRTLIYRTSKDESEFAMAEWILSASGKITGVRLTAKSATSTNPFVRVCPIDLSTCSKSGDILALSDGGMRSYTPASTYTLPPTLSYGPTLSSSPSRPIRTNFKTRSPPAMRLIMKTLSDPPLAANPDMASCESDFFVGKVSVFNNHPPASNNPITITNVTAEYRFIGDDEYKPVADCKLLDGSVLPCSVDPRQTWVVYFQISIPRSEEDEKAQIRWWNRAFGEARKRPLRLRLILEEVEGEQASLVLEYVFKPFPLEKEDEKDLGFFFFDNPDTTERCYVHVQKPDDSWGSKSGPDKVVVKVGSQEFNVKSLHKIVYQALKTGKTEVGLVEKQEKNYGDWEWYAYALVDISCRRVYAIKVIIQQGKNVDESKRRLGCIGYAPCPEYGDVVAGGKTRPVSYATEVVKLVKPAVEWVDQEIPQEDSIDDFKPPIPPKPPVNPVVSPQTPGANGFANGFAGGYAPIPPELTNRLASIDANLARIADVLERLASAWPAANTRP